MGVISDNIAAIRSNPALTADEKRAAIHRAKASALRSAAQAVLPLTFNAGAGLAITVLSAEVDGNALTLELRATLAGVVVELDNPFVFVNPPIQVPDPAGDVIRRNKAGLEVGRVKEAPLLALRQIVADAVRAQT